MAKNKSDDAGLNLKSILPRAFLDRGAQAIDEAQDKDIALLPVDPDWWEEQIYVYTGKQPIVNFDGVTLQRGVPTFVPLTFIKKYSQNTHLAKWVKDDAYERGGEILCLAPRDLRSFMASTLTFDRIAKCFPTCNVVVQCNPLWKNALPSSVSFAERVGSGKYYRTFDFKNKLVLSSLNPLSLSTKPAQELVVSAMGFGHPLQDKGIAPLTAEPTQIKGEGWGFIDTGSVFSKALGEALAKEASVRIYEAGKIDLSVIHEKEKWVVGGECGEALAVGYFGKPGKMFAKVWGASQVLQYKQFKSLSPLPEGSLADVPALAEKLTEWLEA